MNLHQPSKNGDTLADLSWQIDKYQQLFQTCQSQLETEEEKLRPLREERDTIQSELGNLRIRV